jgi:hypothetical protein
VQNVNSGSEGSTSVWDGNMGQLTIGDALSSRGGWKGKSLRQDEKNRAGDTAAKKDKGKEGMSGKSETEDTEKRIEKQPAVADGSGGRGKRHRC